MKYFQSVNSLEELKKQYRKLSLKLHPDREGGDSKAFIAMKDEYDRLFKTLNKETAEGNNDYTDIIDKLSKYDIDIEIIGTWVWVSGNTFAIKSVLKELGFKWSKNKKSWYWHTEGYTRKSRKTFSLDQIRTMHGSEIIKQHSGSKKLTS